jgi:hypothetical protein
MLKLAMASRPVTVLVWLHSMVGRTGARRIYSSSEDLLRDRPPPHAANTRATKIREENNSQRPRLNSSGVVNVLKNDYGISVAKHPDRSLQSKSNLSITGGRACFVWGFASGVQAQSGVNARVSQDQERAGFRSGVPSPIRLGLKSCIITAHQATPLQVGARSFVHYLA